MKLWGLFVLALASPAAATEWQKITSDEAVLAALDDRKVAYATAQQIFYRSGKTLYDSGRPSWGNWRPQAGQYCSEWPPAGGWACYDLFVSTDGTRVRFLGASGDITDGAFEAWSPAE